MIEIMQNKFHNIIEDFIKVCVLIILFFEEIRYVLTGVVILIIADQVTGVWKALKFKQFSWKRFNKLYTKMILYMVAIISTYIYGEYLISAHTHYLTKGLGAVIGFQELSSTYLNISSITGKDILKEYIDKFKSNK